MGTASFEEIKEKIENEEIAKAIIVEKQDNNVKIRYIVENTNLMECLLVFQLLLLESS